MSCNRYLDPFSGNEEAAEFIMQLGSRQRVERSVKHLHDDGIERHRDVLMKIENDVYPQQPGSSRQTKKQFEEHYHKFVVEDAKRRMEHKRKIDAEVHGQLKPLFPVGKSRCKNPSVEEVARRCYEQPLKKIMRKREQLAKKKTIESPTVDPKLRARERGWLQYVRVTPPPLGLLVLSEEKATPKRPAAELEERFNRISAPRHYQKNTKHRFERGPRFITNFKYAK